MKRSGTHSAASLSTPTAMARKGTGAGPLKARRSSTLLMTTFTGSRRCALTANVNIAARNTVTML